MALDADEFDDLNSRRSESVTTAITDGLEWLRREPGEVRRAAPSRSRGRGLGCRRSGPVATLAGSERPDQATARVRRARRRPPLSRVRACRYVGLQSRDRGRYGRERRCREAKGDQRLKAGRRSGSRWTRTARRLFLERSSRSPFGSSICGTPVTPFGRLPVASIRAGRPSLGSSRIGSDTTGFDKLTPTIFLAGPLRRSQNNLHKSDLA